VHRRLLEFEHPGIGGARLYFIVHLPGKKSRPEIRVPMALASARPSGSDHRSCAGRSERESQATVPAGQHRQDGIGLGDRFSRAPLYDDRFESQFSRRSMKIMRVIQIRSWRYYRKCSTAPASASSHPAPLLDQSSSSPIWPTVTP